MDLQNFTRSKASSRMSNQGLKAAHDVHGSVVDHMLEQTEQSAADVHEDFQALRRGQRCITCAV